MADPAKTQSYDFDLDPSFIATAPAEPRDSAKLLVYDRRSGIITDTRFSEILHYLPAESAILFNDTKVIKARLYGHKQSGGKIEILINRPLPENLFSAFVRGKVSEGSKLLFDEGLEAEVVALHEDGSRTLLFTRNREVLDFERLEAMLQCIGHLPLPPYMQREDTKRDEEDYQSVFAKKIGAVAAPTASLHFTPELFASLTRAHAHAFLTLHVGAGTFKPVESEEITAHPMHSEYYAVSDAAQALIRSEKPIVAVGTTVTRTVEYYVRTRQSEGEANLFLSPLNPPQRINHLLTNFHLPKSTLIMLVASFAGLEKTLALYEHAKEKGYRFYSYGDAMLIL